MAITKMELLDRIIRVAAEPNEHAEDGVAVSIRDRSGSRLAGYIPKADRKVALRLLETLGLEARVGCEWRLVDGQRVSLKVMIYRPERARFDLPEGWPPLVTDQPLPPAVTKQASPAGIKEWFGRLLRR